MSAVRTALQAGYRLVDTAAAYFNEREVCRGYVTPASIARRCVSHHQAVDDRLRVRPRLRAFDTSTAKLNVANLATTACGSGLSRSARVKGSGHAGVGALMFQDCYARR